MVKNGQIEEFWLQLNVDVLFISMSVNAYIIYDYAPNLILNTLF